MKKLTVHALVLWALALAVAAVLAAIIPFERNAVYWIAVGCTALAFLLVLAAFFRAFRRDGKLESKVLGWPIFRTAVMVLAVQVVVGFALMGLAKYCPVWVAVLVEVLVLAGCFAVLTVRDAAREAVRATEQSAPDRTQAIKDFRRRAAALASAHPTAAVKELADQLRYADPVSRAATPALEARLDDLLEQAETDADPETLDKLARQAVQLLRQRSAVAKTK